MTRLITYSDSSMTKSAELCAKSSLNHNVHENKVYRETDLPKGMVKEGVRGAGCYWLFKPYLIDKELKKMNEGEVLVYADAGIEFINNINYVVERTKDIFLFGNLWDHYHWCKESVLDAMLPSWRDFSSPKQVQASVIVVRVNEKSKQLVSEWLKWCKKPGMIDDSGVSTHQGFQDHRHDQAILTNVALNNGIDLHWWPAVYENHRFTYSREGYSDPYPALFHHHRKRDAEWR